MLYWESNIILSKVIPREEESAGENTVETVSKVGVEDGAGDCVALLEDDLEREAEDGTGDDVEGLACESFMLSAKDKPAPPPVEVFGIGAGFSTESADVAGGGVVCFVGFFVDFFCSLDSGLEISWEAKVGSAVRVEVWAVVDPKSVDEDGVEESGVVVLEPEADVEDTEVWPVDDSVEALATFFLIHRWFCNDSGVL